ncbi:MAG: tyrosine-type recombinase/integrase [Planctomycetes bacterium]|nr:tyrosine-type recombinase/integrase [Planctomycetota bacterium]
MPRPKAMVPSLRYHISGQAVCEIHGTTYYLGPHGSPESLARYAVLIREYQANGFKVPSQITSRSLQELTAGFAVPVETVNQADEPILVKHVTASYREHIRTIYQSNSIERDRLSRLCDEIDENSGTILADEYGPIALQEQRRKWIESGKSRTYCNRLTNATVRIFKFAVSQELLDASKWQSLKSVEPLRIGQTVAPETEPVVPANLDHVRATAKHLPPQLRAVIRIQVATGARPSEILNMRGCEIDRSGSEWVYRPALHKNAKRGKTRFIPLIGDARDAVIEYLNRDPNSYLFSPKEAVAWHNAQKRAARKSKVQPSQRDRSNPNAEKLPRDRFDVHSYRRAIDRACKKAGVPTWHPYQLRHLAGTLVRDVLGPEAAQALLGHSNIRMTEHYAKLSERKAIEAAKAAPKL